jgi:hypothetical protein
LGATWRLRRGVMLPPSHIPARPTRAHTLRVVPQEEKEPLPLGSIPYGYTLLRLADGSYVTHETLTA